MTETNRILEPSEESENWIVFALEDSVHVFPSLGEKKHHTVNCWCQPKVEFDKSYEKPIFSHNESH